MNGELYYLQNTFQGKVVLITGGTGSIGSEIVRQLITYRPQQIRIYSRDESKHHQLQMELDKFSSIVDIRYLIGDIRDKQRLDMALKRVDIVYHASALKHVKYCEYNPFEAIKTNVLGTKNLIELAIEHNVEKLIAISTDKAVDPSSIMGITKLLMERLIISSRVYIGHAKTIMSVVRFGNVLNSRGSVIPTWIKQIKNGGPVTITDKHMSRYFMSISDAVDLVVSATAFMRGQEVFVLKMPKMNIYDLAQQVIAKYGNGMPIDIKEVGAGEREKTDESLYTKEEANYMIDIGKYYVIFPSKEVFEERRHLYERFSQSSDLVFQSGTTVYMQKKN